MRVLFLTHRVPYAPNRGDRVRAYHIIKALAPHVDLEVVSLAHDAADLAGIDVVREAVSRATALRVPFVRNHVSGAARLGGTTPLTHCLLDAPGLTPLLSRIARERPPDVVLAYCSGMARFATAGALAGVPLVLDMVDVDSRKWSELAVASAWPRRWIYAREARHLGAFEGAAASHARTTLVVNNRERDLLRALAPSADIRVVPNGVDVARLTPPGGPSESLAVVFCGVMNYSPNVEAVLWFARNVWPQVRTRQPHARFLIVGSQPTASVRQLHSAIVGIEVTGGVPDVRPYLWHSAISVAPLLTARGVQNKVLEALATGLPAVVTPQVLEGLPRVVHAGCLVSGSAEGFAAHVVTLLALTAGERRAVANRADVRSLAWSLQLAPIHRILVDAAGAGTRADPVDGLQDEALMAHEIHEVPAG